MGFNRPPRIQLPLPGETVDLPDPPPMPSEPGPFSWLATLAPLGFSLIAVAMMAAFSGGSAAGYLAFLPTVAGGGLVSWIAYRGRGKEYRAGVAKARQEYSDRLDAAERRLRSLRERELELRRESQPSLRECLRRAERVDPRLGCRRPQDSDFLSVRAGTAALPAAYKILPAKDVKSSPPFPELAERADSMRMRFQSIPEAPFSISLSETGHLGAAGPLAAVDSWTRAAICHLAVQHWPSEVNLAVCAGEERMKGWTWSARLPHASPALPRAHAFTASGQPTAWMTALESEVDRREQMLATRKLIHRGAEGMAGILPRMIVVFDAGACALRHPALRRVLERGPQLGIHGLFLAAESRALPAECGAVVRLRGAGAEFHRAGAGAAPTPFRPEGADPPLAEAIARGLCVIDWTADPDGAKPPSKLGWLEMWNAVDAEALPVEDWWEGTPPMGFLRAPIGRSSATADFLFDLADRDGAHGPHGLIGGMTGSGKSEVLRTLILSLALLHHPYDLQFALVDYKGGAAFQDLTDLPHVVGVMTDLEGHAAFAGRFLSALMGEVERRKRILEGARSRFGLARLHADDYRRLRVRIPLPHLVVVFDEFAEFRERHPEEARKLIAVARLGRSLGVHLILATQNIQAAVDPQIMQNASFRICLKVSQPEDSMQMAGVPDGVALTRGQALFYSQGSRLIQVAYTGGGTGGTEALSLIRRARAAAERLGIAKPDSIWKDPLPDRIALPVLIARACRGGWTGGGWEESRRLGGGSAAPAPVIGLCDQPDRQAQPLLEWESAGGGHLLIFGSAGSGKTTLLRTLTAAIARLHPPDQAQMYIVDYGGQGAMKPLAEFPHVGAVIVRGEEERLLRLLRHLRREGERRMELLRRARCGSRSEFNLAAAVEDRLPELFLLIDGYQNLRRAVDPEVLKEIGALLGGSEACGLRLAVTAWGAGDVSSDVFANIGQRITLRQALPSEYLGVVGMPSEAMLQDEASHPPVAGRGYAGGVAPEPFQAALPAEGESERSRAETLLALAAAMRTAWRGALPTPILALPEEVRVESIAAEGDAWRIPFGLDYLDLQPVWCDLRRDGPALLAVGSTPGCGKTTWLRTLLLRAASALTPARLRIWLIDSPDRTLAPLAALPHVEKRAANSGETAALLAALAGCLESRRPPEDGLNSGMTAEEGVVHLLAVDDYEKFAARCEEGVRLLEGCAEVGEGGGFLCLAAGGAAQLPRDFDDGFVRRAHRSGAGILLGPNSDADSFANARMPSAYRDAPLPPGRGFRIGRGRAELYQTAVYWDPGEAPDSALRRWVHRIVAADRSAAPAGEIAG